MTGLVAFLWLISGPFCGHSICHTGLEDQGCCCLVLNNILGGSCVRRC